MRPSVCVAIPSIVGDSRLVALAGGLVESSASPRVVIADNGLLPATSAALRSAGADVLPMGRNRGFGAAVNRVARQVASDVLVVLNDDVGLVERVDLVTALAAPLRGSYEMAAAVVVDAANTGVVENAGLELDASLNVHSYLHGAHVDEIQRAPGPPLGPCGVAAAYLREAFLDVGGFDESFFAYWEDVDLAIRLRAAGARCALAATARATHDRSRTLGWESVDKAAVVGRSRGYFLRKYGAFARPRVAMRVVPAELASCGALVARHRSFRPVAARAAGWRDCRRRAVWPHDLRPTVGWLDGNRRRFHGLRAA